MKNQCTCPLKDADILTGHAKDCPSYWQPPTTDTSDWRKGLEWTAKFDYLLYNFKNAVRHEVEGTNISSYETELLETKSALFAFIANELEKAREEAKLSGIKIGNATGAGYKRGIADGRAAERARVREVIKGMKVKAPWDKIHSGYNRALNDLLDTLKD